MGYKNGIEYPKIGYIWQPWCSFFALHAGIVSFSPFYWPKIVQTKYDLYKDRILSKKNIKKKDLWNAQMFNVCIKLKEIPRRICFVSDMQGGSYLREKCPKLPWNIIHDWSQQQHRFLIKSRYFLGWTFLEI